MFSYFLFNVIGQNSASLALNENLVVERDKNWLKNEGKNVVRVNGYLQRINRSWALKRKEYFMGINGSLAECSWSIVARKQSAHGSLS